MNNRLVADIFRDIGTILQVQGENVFRVRAYLRAASSVQSWPEDVAVLARQQRLSEIPGIGNDLAAKIREIVATGTCAFYEDLKKHVPQGVLDLLTIPSIGPKTAKLLSEKLRVAGIPALKQAIKENRLQGIPGIKTKTIENIARGIELLEKSRQRMSLAEADRIAAAFIQDLQRVFPGERQAGRGILSALVCAGSLRRQKESVRDLDLLIVSSQPQKVMDAFVSLPQVRQVLAHGLTKSSVRTRSNVQVDCRVVNPGEFGAALLYFTGSKEFNVRLRQLAQKKGWKLSEYGVFDARDRRLAGSSEEQIFKLFGMQYIEPELREDSGEIELALKHALPRLVEAGDIRGDLHCHSNWSDGINSMEEMCAAAQARGYSYIAFTDHSQSLKVASGLSPAQLLEKKKQIDRLNRRLKGLRALFGAEVDIDADGKLDYPDSILKEFDVVIAAIHTGFKQSAEQITRRLLAACENKYVQIIAHPTGRLRGVREAYDIDMPALLKKAKETSTCLEVNSYPDRLDLSDVHCRMAKEAGVRISVNTDSHSVEHLENIRYGLAMCRRGWLEPRDVLNACPLAEVINTTTRSACGKL